MQLHQQILIGFLWIASSMFASTAYSNDIARDIREGREAAGSADGGFLELGLSAIYYDLPITGMTDGERGVGIGIALNGQYEWRGLFIEAMTESERGLTFGYNFGGTDSWQLDLVLSNQHDEISDEIDDELMGLRARKADFMLGMRSTHYFGKSIAQLAVLGDISDRHHGVVLNAAVGRFWQVRNWNLHSVLQLRHRSAKIVDYYVGIREDEANEQFAAYEADAGNEIGLELGLTYPLNEKWILRSTTQFYWLSSELSDSPLARDNNGLTWLTSVTRVFE